MSVVNAPAKKATSALRHPDNSKTRCERACIPTSIESKVDNSYQASQRGANNQFYSSALALDFAVLGALASRRGARLR